MRITIALTLAVVVAAGSALANNGLALLKVEAGARPSGMGSAFVTIDQTPDAISYNPAGAVGVSNFTLSVGHNSYWEDVRMETTHFAMGLSPKVFLHGGLRFAAVDGLEQRGDVPTVDPDGLFDLHDVSFKGGLSFQITDRLATGFGLGWIIEKIGPYRGSVFNFDYGLQARLSDNLALGASATNIGSDFVLTKNTGDESDLISLPTAFRLGGSYNRSRYLGAVEIVHLDGRLHVHLGAETQIQKMFAARAGWVSNYDTEKFSAGASFTKRNLTVDYAFVPYRRGLGTSHMFNLSFSL